MISRADMAERGVPPTTAGGWYRDRARTGHPEKAGRIGRTDYWYEDEWAAWHEGYKRRKVESLTRADRGGDLDDLVDATEAARMLRYSSRHVIHANRRLGYSPGPDAYGPGARGRPAPLWKRSTVVGRGRRPPGQGGGHRPGTPGLLTGMRYLSCTATPTTSWPVKAGQDDERRDISARCARSRRAGCGQ